MFQCLSGLKQCQVLHFRSFPLLEHIPPQNTRLEKNTRLETLSEERKGTCGSSIALNIKKKKDTEDVLIFSYIYMLLFNIRSLNLLL